MENDTIRLLRECDAGVQMGVDSITDVLDDVKDAALRDCLNASKTEHERLRDELQHELFARGDDGKAPNPMAKGMSKLKTGMHMLADRSDATIADLMIDGCDMGVKSLSKYLNRFPAADDRAKALTHRLIALEDKLSADLRAYL